MQPDDEAAVAEARNGDQTAFRTLVDRHSRHIYRLAYRIVGRHEDAEDVVQETFVRAYRQLDRFEARSNFATWLHRIGFNCAIDYGRARRAREVSWAPDTLEDLAPPPATPSSEDLLFGGQIADRVQAALAELTMQERAAFELRHFQGCTIDEICTVLDLGPSAAKHAVFRAVKKMRAALRPFVAERTRG